MDSTTSVSREEMTNALLWNSGGTSWDSVQNLRWILSRPKPGENDLPSVVLVSGSADDYSDDELIKIYEFSIRVTAKYDELRTRRIGSNLVMIGKPQYAGGEWLSKQLTWSMGRMTSPTLDEAIRFMEEAIL